jgi:hypothetical protein
MTTRRFVLIAEGDVFMQVQFDDEISSPNAAAWAAGLASNPTVIEVTDQPNVVPGWAWNGDSFTPPQ